MLGPALPARPAIPEHVETLSEQLLYHWPQGATCVSGALEGASSDKAELRSHNASGQVKR